MSVLPALDLSRLSPTQAERLRQKLDGTRSVLRAHQRSCRTALQFLADLEEELEAAVRTAQGGTAHESDHSHRGR